MRAARRATANAALRTGKFRFMMVQGVGIAGAILGLLKLLP